MIRFEVGKTYIDQSVELTCMKRDENSVWFAEQPNASEEYWIEKHLIAGTSEEEFEDIFESKDGELGENLEGEEYTYFGDYTFLASDVKGESHG